MNWPSAATMALFVPIVIFMIPIVAILTSHQRKMAEIIHSRKAGDPGEIEALRREVSQLKELIHQQSIAIDNLSAKQALHTPGDVQSRLGS